MKYSMGLDTDTLDEYEDTKQRIANMMDSDEWKWLKARIFDEALSWPQIMDLVADNI